jgi:predicted CXXCH cytochrome family protein
MLELAAPLFVVALAAFCLARLARGAGVARFAVAAAMGLAWVPFAVGRPRREPEPPAPVRPSSAGEYVTSAACRSCHPSEYASWHDSYHRTMTQVARAGAVLAPLARPVSLDLDGRAYGLGRKGDDVWATLPDAPPRRVAMTTGSHHYQAYWMEGDELALFPFVYLLADRRWLPRRDAFVEPPGADATVHWQSNCIQCHATGGSPGYTPAKRTLDPEAAELGIACEACHGPGAAHVDKHGDPFERYAAYAKDAVDTTIVNPSRLDAGRASMICGACHAYTYPRDEEDFWAHGYARSFRPGQDLESAKVLLTAAGLGRPGSPTVDTAPENLFYDDGTVRIGGREYNGLVLSACYRRGEGTRKLGCPSCHSMHDSAPEGQLARGREGDAACTPCHDGARYAARSHTHHAPGSAGSACMGCHMPMTAYALLKGIRSHRIDSPEARDLGASDRPNACNLCHLDRSLAWTASALQAWYGHEAPLLAGTDAAGAAWLLSGDPGQRAIAAAAMSSPGARAAVGATWQAPLLRAALADPYAAVRFIAARSLGALPASGDPGDRALVDALVAARSTRALTLSE